MPSSTVDVTGLLSAWGRGEASALKRLIPVVYQDLRRMAHQNIARERSGHTLQTTELINEAYLRLIDSQRVRWQDRAHFFAVAAKLMRRVLVDYARSRNFQKRGAGIRTVSLAENLEAAPGKSPDLVLLDQALEALAAVDFRKSRVVEMKFFGGLNVDEIAEVLKVSPQTVLRDWKLSKTWLLHELARLES
jgi:RNA polymerase sigma factor (TIGR02999 family)